MKRIYGTVMGVVSFALVIATGNLAPAEDASPKKAGEEAKPKKEGEPAGPKQGMARPVRNGVFVRTSSRAVIGVLDKDAELEVLLTAGEWCKVQYTKDGNRFVGWVLKEDLVLPDQPPGGEETKPKTLSVNETSEQLRKLARVGIAYKTSRAESWNPNDTVGVKHTRSGTTQMTLDFTGGGQPAKMAVLARFRRDHAIELYVEKKTVELKEFQKIANPLFDRIINSYVRALEAYKDSRIPDFKRLIESADDFWAVIDQQAETETQPVFYVPL